MRNVLLIAHVFAAVLFVGPSTFASSAFMRYATTDSVPVAEALHRTTRAYGTCALAVAAIGVALAANQRLLDQTWVWASLVLFLAGSVVLLAVAVPAQRGALADIGGGRTVEAGTAMRARTAAGLYALSWAAVLVLMITKP